MNDEVKDTITLQNKTGDGDTLEAIFFPGKGMNMISFKLGDVQVIDQSTSNLFQERYAGLGALIGPHFHHRNPNIIPPIKDETLFPHIARIQAKGIKEPFSHGIARYAPWQAQATSSSIKAVLNGKDLWNGVPLADLEGQNFKMTYDAELTSGGLDIEVSVVSESDSIVGLHYYYYLPQGKGTIVSAIQNHCLEDSVRKPIPSDWNVDGQHVLKMVLDGPLDHTLYPYPNPLEGNIRLETDLYNLVIKYSCLSQENSWQLYHPAGASFVCIEPLSAQDPRHPNLTVSSLRIQLQILKGNKT